MIIITHRGKEIKNVNYIYFAEDGKLDITFNDGKEPTTIESSCIKEIKE